MEVRIGNDHPIDGEKSWIDDEDTATVNICITAGNEIQKSPNGLRNDFDGINGDGALRRDLVATLHLLRDGMTSFLVEVLGYPLLHFRRIAYPYRGAV